MSLLIMGPLFAQVEEIVDLWEGGKKRKAIRTLRKWEKEAPDKPGPYVATARLKFLQKKYKSCLRACKKALKKDPNNADAYYWRGRAYENLEKPLEAANEYSAALRARKGFKEALDGLNRVKSQLEKSPLDARAPEVK